MSNELLEIYLLEANSGLENLEQLVLIAEDNGFDLNAINEIFRVMHSLKGSSASMGYDNITAISHLMENVFHKMRENVDILYDIKKLSDLLFQFKDFVMEELVKIAEGLELDGNPELLKKNINEFYEAMGNTSEVDEEEKSTEIQESNEIKTFFARVFFNKDAGMENVRSMIMLQNLSEQLMIIETIPKVLEDEKSCQEIVNKGFSFTFESLLNKDALAKLIEANTLCFESLHLEEKVIEDIKTKEVMKEITSNPVQIKENSSKQIKKEYLSIPIDKLDTLMDITSEIIITEALLVQNPDLQGMDLQNFQKVARQFRKITNELQDVVMSLRMLPISNTFNKMKRITRDAAEKLNKKIELLIIGENTEVDKNIVEYVSDPLMHIIRNSIDHGIEENILRKERGKPEIGKILLEAKHVGSEVWIVIKDDGGGLNKEKIYEKAFNQGLTNKQMNEIDEGTIYKFIFQPGFSTKETATEMSGRGVGMDVVLKNLEKIKGSISIDESSIRGTTMTLKIPLTLAIIDGVTVKVGENKYSLPIESIKEILALKKENIISDTYGNELINIRNNYYPLVKLYEKFDIPNSIMNLTEGIAFVIKANDESICIFVDKLIGEQQIVVKPLPIYMKNVKGISGCTLLGDGTISLVLDSDNLVNNS